jgi:mono/diheme cytochrome c family protein
MSLHARISRPVGRHGCVLLSASILVSFSARALGQTYGAQQAVRRSVDNLGASAGAAEPPADAASPAAVSYQRQVRPILQANCHGCHRPDKASGGLDMTAFTNLLGSGESGAPAVVPGNPDESYVVALITPRGGEAAMPQGKRPLAASQIALIRRWIEEGANNDGPPDVSREGYGRDAYGSERSRPYESSSTASGMIDTKYVSPTAIAVVALRPAQILSAPIAELLPREVLTAVGQQYFGFDPASVEEVVAFVGPINLMGPTDYGVTFKFSEPIRAASIKREVRAHAQLSEFAGKRYLQSKHPVLPSFYGPDNRTLLVAPDATLRRLIETTAEPKTGPVIDRISAVPAGSDLYLAVDAATLRPFMEMGMAQAKTSGKLPPQAEKFLELPKLISAAELTFNLSGSGPMSLVVHANDDAAAQQLESMLLEASNAPGASPDDRYTAQDPVAQAVTQYLERFSQPFRPQRSGTSVTLFRAEAQSAAQQQLASLTVFGVGVGMQAAQAAAARGAATAAGLDGIEGGANIDPAQPAESSVPAEYPRR